MQNTMNDVYLAQYSMYFVSVHLFRLNTYVTGFVGKREYWSQKY